MHWFASAVLCRCLTVGQSGLCGILFAFFLNALLRQLVTNPVESCQEQNLCCSLGAALSKLCVSGVSVLAKQDPAALTSLRALLQPVWLLAEPALLQRHSVLSRCFQREKHNTLPKGHRVRESPCKLRGFPCSALWGCSTSNELSLALGKWNLVVFAKQFFL